MWWSLKHSITAIDISSLPTECQLTSRVVSWQKLHCIQCSKHVGLQPGCTLMQTELLRYVKVLFQSVMPVEELVVYNYDGQLKKGEDKNPLLTRLRADWAACKPSGLSCFKPCATSRDELHIVASLFCLQLNNTLHIFINHYQQIKVHQFCLKYTFCSCNEKWSKIFWNPSEHTMPRKTN